MYTERQAIQDELHSNRREIQSLRDRNMDLLKRLRDLDERDLNDDISYDALASLTESLKECIDKLSQLVPSVSALDVIKHITEDVNPGQIMVAKNEISNNKAVAASLESPAIQQPRIIEESKSETQIRIDQAVTEQKNNSIPTKQKLSIERSSSIIKEILEDLGTAKVKDIEKEFYKRTGAKYANFYEKMARASEIYPNIQKVSMGKWIIKRSPDNRVVPGTPGAALLKQA